MATYNVSKEPNQVKWRGIKLAHGESFLPTGPAKYQATPASLDDGDLTPLLVDQCGRPIVVQYEKDRNITHWGGTALTGRDISADLANLSKGWQFFRSKLDSYSLSANSTYDWLSISGKGFFSCYGTYMTGILPYKFWQRVNPDNIGFYEHFPWIFEGLDLNYWGFGGVGTYNFGFGAVRVKKWDTTNNVYEAIGSLRKLEFKSSLILRIGNEDPSNSATVTTTVHYSLFASSRRISLKLKEDKIEVAFEVHKAIRRDFKYCDAVICDFYSPHQTLYGHSPKAINIRRLQIIVNDEVYEKHRDKIIKGLIKHKICEDILEDESLRFERKINEVKKIFD